MLHALLTSRLVRIFSAFSAGLITLAIIYLSLIPSEGVPAAQISDKIRHFMAYAALAAPLTLALGRQRALIALICATLLGAGLEIAQMLGDAGREGSVADGVANFLGALLGAGAVWLLTARPSRSHSTGSKVPLSSR